MTNTEARELTAEVRKLSTGELETMHALGNNTPRVLRAVELELAARNDRQNSSALFAVAEVADLAGRLF